MNGPDERLKTIPYSFSVFRIYYYFLRIRIHEANNYGSTSYLTIFVAIDKNTLLNNTG